MIENNNADNIKFSSDELKQFDSELAKIQIKGSRLPEIVQVFSDVDAPEKNK